MQLTLNSRLKQYPSCVIKVAVLAFACVHAASAATTSSDNESAVFHQIQERAAALAGKPYQKPSTELPPFLSDLNYDQYRDVRFQPSQSLWLKERLPFQVQFFSRASIFREKVLVNIVDKGEVTPVDFESKLFDFGRLPVPGEIPTDLGFAGFRLHYPLNKKNQFDEIIAFLGASYFRAVGRREAYGLSARGLALNTVTEKGEEFPVFREFWIEKPEHRARQITLYALLDSPSVAGAYRFVIKPSATTTMDVTAHLYFRSKVQKLGVAPLTSMFYFGKNTEHDVDDFRTEVHDSDGLWIQAGNGERLWRPLNNTQRLGISDYRIENPRSFGLMQRERNFADYQDLEADYQRRPSAWVEPVGDWGTGTIELVEIPTNDEYHDNIVTYWIPEEPATAGSSRSFEYTLNFGKDPEPRTPPGRVSATRIGAGKDTESGQRLFVIDFEGPALTALPTTAELSADINASTGTLGKPVVQRNPYIRGYRVSFEFTPGKEQVSELRCTLHQGSELLSETWTYQWRKEER
jgi:glucans biosynthesis protein